MTFQARKFLGTFEKQAPGPFLLVFLCRPKRSFQAHLPWRNIFLRGLSFLFFRSRVGFDLKQEKEPVRGEQSLEKVVELRKHPRAVSSNVVESQNPREETREQTHDYPVASTIPQDQKLDETCKEDLGIELQRI